MTHMIRNQISSGISLLTLAIIFIATASTTHADTEYRKAMAKAVRNTANRVLPSVVAIEIVGTVQGAAGEIEQDAPTSGVIVDADGFVIASSIVVSKTAASILVVLSDGSRHAAKVVARDYHRDLVLLKMNQPRS